jgi:hypothetical protein
VETISEIFLLESSSLVAWKECERKTWTGQQVSSVFLDKWVRCANHPYLQLRAMSWITKDAAQPELIESNTCILKAHLHSKSGGSIWASLECQCCFWIAGGLRMYSKSSLTLKEWRFNFSFPWVSMLFLNSWRVTPVF